MTGSTFENEGYTDDLNPLPWSVDPNDDAVVLDANGVAVANFQTRHLMRGVLANCTKNADYVVRAVNAYRKRDGADLAQLSARIKRWADEQFPDRSYSDILLKAFEEIGELVRDPTSPGEIADVLILMLDIAAKARIDPFKATSDKMDINEQRTWVIDPNTRIMRHES